MAWIILAKAWTYWVSPRKASGITAKLLRLGIGKVSLRSLRRRQYQPGVWEIELPSPRREKRNNGATVGAYCPPAGVSSLRLLSVEHSCDIGSLSSVRILLMAHVVAEVSVRPGRSMCAEHFAGSRP
ncbi:hypothetical protein B296_00043252 [Ensete ventricosum]|uniref:Uncharacterized protein n=1 Tax=Ensete ventricosum TaxID=4639 RepID=A0A426XI19_ENSVE|nr:hypothetical protein B296_00043252 [Ensete ventricosum]